MIDYRQRRGLRHLSITRPALAETLTLAWAPGAGLVPLALSEPARRVTAAVAEAGRVRLIDRAAARELVARADALARELSLYHFSDDLFRPDDDEATADADEEAMAL